MEMMCLVPVAPLLCIFYFGFSFENHVYYVDIKPGYFTSLWLILAHHFFHLFISVFL